MNMPNPEPAPARKETMLDRLAREKGMHPDTLIAHIKKAKWSPERFHAAIKKPDWWEVLQHDAFEAVLDDRVSDVGPPAFRNASDETLLAKMTPRLRAWVERYNGRSAVLLGPTGIGKSVAAFVVLRRVKREQERKRLEEAGRLNIGYGDDGWPEPDSRWRDGWISAQDLLTSQRCHPLGQDEAPEVYRAKTRRLVVVDDISWPSRDELTREVLFARCDRGLPTIVTAGLPKADLFERFTDAFSRRCLDVSGERGAFIDEFNGGKLR